MLIAPKISARAIWPDTGLLELSSRRRTKGTWVSSVAISTSSPILSSRLKNMVLGIEASSDP